MGQIQKDKIITIVVINLNFVKPNSYIIESSSLFMNLASATVVIPAHNRPEKLRRLLHYYSKTTVKVIVSDSSGVVFPYLSEFPGLNYVHCPKDQFLRKIYNILPLIKTKYVVYCADDDFIVPEAIGQCIEFLDQHPGYNSAQGHTLSFETNNHRLEFFPSYIRNFDKDINQDLPSERLLEFRDLYASLLYSVIRANTFIEMYSQCIEGETLKFKNLFLAEIYFNFFSLIEGKNKTLPVFYAAREKDYASATYSTVPLSTIRSSPQYEEEFRNFTDLVIQHLVSKQDMDPETAKDLILKLLQDPKKNYIHPLKRNILNFLDTYGPTKLMNRYKRYKYKMKGLEITKGMNSYPISFSTPEKEMIVRHISRYQ